MEPGASLILHTGLPLPVLMIVVGAIFLMTLLISRFSLKAGIPDIFGRPPPCRRPCCRSTR
jgi:hypothetical protein